ncbi:hypothetical protein SLS62_011170 [Diatrype stigma]|uniref:Uncharacterized protein n=1 Tax=Diatrype stigma TaxID=117547 RepID=A0AAN9U5L1_9PEZI
MLKDHIRWNSEDQKLCDQIDPSKEEVVDEMTQELSESEWEHYHGHQIFLESEYREIKAYFGLDSDTGGYSDGGTNSEETSDAAREPENDELGSDNEGILDSSHDDHGTTSTHERNLATGNQEGFTNKTEDPEDVPNDTFFGVGHEETMAYLREEHFLT